MSHRFGGRTPAVLATLVLAAAVGAAPAPAAQSGHNDSDLAACNALLTESALGLGSLDSARAAAGRGGPIRHEPLMPVTDIEVPAGAVPEVPGNFTATIPVYFHVINKGPTLADGNVSQAQIEAQIAALNETFSGARGGPDTGFRFVLREVTRTTNQEWFDMTKSRVERGEAGAAPGRDGRAQHLFQQRRRLPRLRLLPEGRPRTALHRRHRHRVRLDARRGDRELRRGLHRDP